MRWVLVGVLLLSGCCAHDVLERPPGFRIGAVLGYDLVPFVPILYLSNTLTAEEVLDHTYGGRFGEDNGLIYTCRGGVVDMAHVRDCADWTGYVARQLAAGRTVELPRQGARRFAVRLGRGAHTVDSISRIAAHVVYTFYVWHEIVTWYGWGTVSVYPEKVSSFSPEDMYSNLLGVQIGAAAYRRTKLDGLGWNAAVRAELSRRTTRLGVTDEATTRRALDAVEGPGGWWDRSQGFPRSAFVRRRNISLALRQVPWQVPDPQRFCRRAGCPHTPLALELSNRGSDYTLQIEVDTKVLKRFPLPRGRRTIDASWFPSVLADLRRQAKTELGPLADRPDRAIELPSVNGRSVSIYRSDDGTWQARVPSEEPGQIRQQRGFRTLAELKAHFLRR